ncbi:MAG: FIST N-terminal domain-containing protein [Candidatus Eisenbacteria bacterium]
MNDSSTNIARFLSHATSARDAIADVAGQIPFQGPALVALFLSPDYDRDEAAEAIAENFGNVPVIGCTTAGEISPDGYQRGGVSGFALPADDFDVEVGVIDGIDDFEYRDGVGAATEVRRRMESRIPGASGLNTFAFLLVDGMSRKEEPVVAAIHPSLGDIQLFGGSAGDGGAFQASWVFHGGTFATKRAVLTLVHTNRSFAVFRTQHFVSSGQRLVVTGSDPSRRLVYEIDGERATEAYARHLGIPEESLGSTVFACHPVVVQMGGEYFVRSIMQHHPDGSIEFACAIDQGVVLRLAEGVDMVANLEESLDGLRDRVGDPDLIIGCDCLFRRVEAEATDVRSALDEILRKNHVVGFTSYGEQYNAVHVNQTLTGVAIGPRKAA